MRGSRGRIPTKRSESGSGCSPVHRGSEKHDTGFRRTGRLAKVAGWTGGLGHATRPSELAPIAGGCCLGVWHSHADSTPCRVFPSPYGRLLAPNGPGPPSVDVYIGERLGMGSTAIGPAPSRMWTCGAVATGRPSASTPVASRSPIVQIVSTTKAPCTAAGPVRRSMRCEAARATRSTFPRCSSGR